MKFVVDRTNWYRGQGFEASLLLRTEDGKMCCIGFVGQQCGVPVDVLAGMGAVMQIPYGYKRNFPSWMRDLKWPDGVASGIARAYSLNDDREITEEQREEGLKDLFLEMGDEIEFIN